MQIIQNTTMKKFYRKTMKSVSRVPNRRSTLEAAEYAISSEYLAFVFFCYNLLP